jgi:hypothetical protein
MCDGGRRRCAQPGSADDPRRLEPIIEPSALSAERAAPARVTGSFFQPGGSNPPSATSDSPAGAAGRIRGLLPPVLPLSRFCEQITSLTHATKSLILLAEGVGYRYAEETAAAQGLAMRRSEQGTAKGTGRPMRWFYLGAMSVASPRKGPQRGSADGRPGCPRSPQVKPFLLVGGFDRRSGLPSDRSRVQPAGAHLIPPSPERIIPMSKEGETIQAASIKEMNAEYFRVVGVNNATAEKYDRLKKECDDWRANLDKFRRQHAASMDEVLSENLALREEVVRLKKRLRAVRKAADVSIPDEASFPLPPETAPDDRPSRFRLTPLD